MHVYTSVLTSDEVKCLIAEYAIPSDLHPCVPPSGLTMNRLPIDKIGKGDSSVADPPPTGVHAEDIYRLCENIIDLHLVHPAMLYAIGLTTIWKHVGHHPVFKDGEGIVATSMSQFLKFLMVGGVRVGKGTALAANETAKDRAVGKRAATEGASHRPKKKKTMPLSFALSDFEADGSNRSGFGTHHYALPLNTIIPNEAELTTGGDGLILESVNRVEEDTDHNLDNVEDTTKVNSPLFEHSPRSQHSNPFDKDTHNFVLPSFVLGHGVISSSGSSHRQAFLRHNPGGNDIGSSLRGDVGLHVPFVPAWNLTTHSILNDAESCRDMMINLATFTVRDQQNWLSDYQALQCSWFKLGRGALAQIDILQRYKALNKDYEELYESHQFCQHISDRLTEIQNQLVDTVRSQNKLSDDHNALQEVHLGCFGKEADLTKKLAAVEKERDDLLDKNQEREEQIKQLEADLASKTSSLTEAECAVSTLKGELECLTVDLSHAEIVRHNYVHHLLPTVFQRLISSDEYKKSMSDVFNPAIAAGWSEGVKAACSKEEA
ncbi:hypothetical protein Tco_1125368 [Tanacetum coccineum]|uniref:Uncharacterized protein n=1 Tax=Tanacetum coccineum TaxID=301880 RepID=A0ABQ5JBU8_9ASTR